MRYPSRFLQARGPAPSISIELAEVGLAVEGGGPTGRLEDSETGFRRMAQLVVELDGVGKLPGL